MQWSLVALLGCGAGIVTMAATMPAGFAARMTGVSLPPDVRLAGTLWNGSADFAGGHRAAWESRGWGSLMALAWVADLRLTGPETDLQGQWALRPGEAAVAPLRGRTGWSLIDAAMPGLEITCATTAKVDLARAVIGPAVRAATGQVRLAAGTCARVDGTVRDVPLPALVTGIATSDEGIGIAITGADEGVPLGTLLLTPDDRLRVTVLAAGAAMVPGLPQGGDSQIELPLSLFAR